LHNNLVQTDLRSLSIEWVNVTAVWPGPTTFTSCLWQSIRCQFQQRSMSSFYACRSQKCKKILTTWLSSYALVSYRCKELHVNMLMKSTPGVNFINVLWAAFTLVDPKSVKKIDDFLWLSFLRFWAPRALKLWQERWWNWPQFGWLF